MINDGAKADNRQPSAFGRALRNVGWLLTGKGIGAVLSLVYLALATRSLGPEKFGEFTLILSIGQAVAALVGFQTWQVVIRFGMPHLKNGRVDALGRLVRFCAALDFAAASIGCVLAWASIRMMGTRLGWSAEVEHEALLFCFVLLLSVRTTAVGVLRLHNRFRTGAIADAVTPLARFGGALVVVLGGASVRGFLIAWAVAEFVTAIAYWSSAHHVAPGLLGRWGAADRAPRENPGLWHFAFATNVDATLNVASKQCVVVLVGLVTGPAMAGGYRLAYQLSQALLRVSEMFSRGIFPEFTRAGTGKTGQELRLLFRQSSRLALAVGTIICVIVPLAGEPILHLIAGKTYVGAYPVLLLLGLASGLEIVGAGFEPVLLGIGRAGLVLRIRVLAVLVLVAGVALLMPGFAASGAAAATLLSAAVALVLMIRAASVAVRRMD